LTDCITNFVESKHKTLRWAVAKRPLQVILTLTLVLILLGIAYADSPTMSGLHLENVGGTTYNTAGGITAGTTVVYMHYTSYYGGENGMAQVDYAFTIARAGSNLPSIQDTTYTDPPPRGTMNGFTLNGACKISGLMAMLLENVTMDGGVAFDGPTY